MDGGLILAVQEAEAKESYKSSSERQPLCLGCRGMVLLGA